MRGVGLAPCAAPFAPLSVSQLLSFLCFLASPGVAVDGDDFSVMDEPVDEGDETGGVWEGLAPLREGAVCGDYG